MARTRQPQGPARIDWSNPLTRGMTGLVSAHAGIALELVQNVGPIGTFGTGYTIGVGKTGIRCLRADGAGGVIFGSPGQKFTPQNYTHLIFGSFSVIDSGWGGLFSASNASGSDNTVGVQRYDTTDNLYAMHQAISGAATWTGGVSSFFNSTDQQLVLTSPNSADISFYKNGILETVQSATHTPLSVTDGRLVLFGARNADSGYASAGDCYLHGTWNRVLSANEILFLWNAPWQLFAPQRRIWVQLGAAAGGATTTVEPSKGALTVTGYLPGIEQDRSVAPAVGHATLTGYAPGIEQDKAVAPAKGALTLTGYVPTLTQPRSIAAVKGALTVAGYAPTVQQTASGTIAPSKGALALTGYAPGLEQDRAIAPSKGALVVTGGQPGVVQNVTTFIAPSKGALTLAGYAPGIAKTANQAIAPSTGTLTLAGYAPVLTQTGAQIIGPIKGSLTLSGKQPTVQVVGTGVTVVEPLVGALTLTGHAPLVRVAVTPAAGGYRLVSGSSERRRPRQENARRPR